jgi:hypothetical protein
LTDLERQHLMLLLEIRAKARSALAEYDEALEDFVLDLRESGASARGLEDAVGVPYSTIQTWTRKARERRKQRDS